MTFVYPNFFWIMIVPFLLFVVLVLSNREKVARIFDAKVLERLRADSDVLPAKIRSLLVFASIFLMIVALARPVIERGERTITLKGLHAMAAIDISGSMRSRDIYPNRLEFGKKKLTQLLQAMPTDEVALTAFAHVSFMLAPFTSDKATLEQIIDGVNEGYINMASTDFTALGSLAEKMLEKRTAKILIVVSDGGDREALEGFAQILKTSGITLYAILVGTEKGAPVLNGEGKTMQTKSGSIAITQINKELGEIAKESGGDFVVAGNGKEDMERLVATIRSKFGDKAQGKITIKERSELFVYLLMGALFLLLLGFSSIPRRRDKTNPFAKTKNRTAAIVVGLSFVICTPGTEAGITDFKVIDAAKKAYTAKDYNTSGRLFEKLRSDTPEVNYDRGNAYYKAAQYDRAIAMYKRAKGAGVDELERLHNLGNAYFKKKQPDSAITSYEAALKSGEDKDTRYNLALSKKMKKKQQEKKKREKKKKEKEKKKKKKQNNKKQKKKKEPKKKNDKNKKQKQKPKKKNDDKDKGKKKSNKQKDGKGKESDKQKDGKRKKSDKQKDVKSNKGEKKGESKGSKGSQKKSKEEQAKKLRAKELNRLMKKMGNKKMPTLMYRAGSGKKSKRREDVNPW